MSNQLQFALVLIVTSVFGLAYISWQVTQFQNAALAFGAVTERGGESVARLDEPRDLGYSSVLFLGDVMLGRNVEYLSRIHGWRFPFAYTKELFVHPIIVANFESAEAIPHRRSRAGTFRFSTEPLLSNSLAESGVTHVSLANNHSYDFGSAGYARIQNTLLDSGITPFGHPTSLASSSVAYFEIGGVSVAVIGIHTLFTPPDPAALEAVIKESMRQSEFQIAYVHWGDEYQRSNNADQERLATLLIEYGADSVIGHHPHVAQNIDLINGVPVFYSLGNFIFDQYFSREVQEGYLLALSFQGESVVYDLVPISSYYSRSQPQPMPESDQGRFLAELAALSAEPVQADILKKQLILPFSLATRP